MSKTTINFLTAFAIGFCTSITAALIACKGAMPSPPTWIFCAFTGLGIAAKDTRSFLRLPPINGDSNAGKFTAIGLSLIAVPLLVIGCGTLKPEILFRVQAVAEAAAYGGTQGALIEVPGWRADFEAAQARIQKLADSGHVTPADLANFMTTLKISELKSNEVRLGISSARTVYLLASGTTTAINADALSLAAARGIAVGMRKALAGE